MSQTSPTPPTSSGGAVMGNHGRIRDALREAAIAALHEAAAPVSNAQICQALPDSPVLVVTAAIPWSTSTSIDGSSSALGTPGVTGRQPGRPLVWPRQVCDATESASHTTDNTPTAAIPSDLISYGR